MSSPMPDEGGRAGRRRRSGRRSKRGSRSSLPRRLGYALQDRVYALKDRAQEVGDAWHVAIGHFGDRAAVAILSLLSLARRALSRGLALTKAVITPLRTVVAVTALAAVALGVAQFIDYRAVEIGVAGYEGYGDVESVAPPPQVDRETAGSAHAYALVPVALAALAALFLCVRGRRHLARTISLLGVIAIAVSLIVDLPAALDVGEQAALYQGTEPALLEGFWVQLSAAITLLVGGILISRYSAPLRRGARATPPRRAGAATGLRGAA